MRSAMPRSAQPTTPNLPDALQAGADTSRRLAIVSNNSVPAIEKYLGQRGLRPMLDRVIGRYDGMPPRFLKPSNHLVGLALIGMDAAPGRTTLVGDSVSDVD